MIIHTIREECFDVNSYLIQEQNHAILIDPILTDRMRYALGGIKLDFVILTHEHFDHIRGVNDLRDALNSVRVLCGEKAVKGLADPRINMSRYADMLKEYLTFGNGMAEVKEYICEADDTLADEQDLIWQEHILHIRETPGHSIGGITILFDGKYLFSGDTIFQSVPTATRMPGGSTKQYRQITQPWLESLPQDIMVYPGHTEAFFLKDRYQNKILSVETE